MNRQVMKSIELKAFQILDGRMDFIQEQKYRYQRALKGYLGEKKFSKILKKYVNSNHIALHGLTLENQASRYQLDCLLIFFEQNFVN